MDKPLSRADQLASELADKFRQNGANVDKAYTQADEKDECIKALDELHRKLACLATLMNARAQRLEKTGYSEDSDFARTIASRATTYSMRLEDLVIAHDTMK